MHRETLQDRDKNTTAWIIVSRKDRNKAVDLVKLCERGEATSEGFCSAKSGRNGDKITATAERHEATQRLSLRMRYSVSPPATSTRKSAATAEWHEATQQLSHRVR